MSFVTRSNDLGKTFYSNEIFFPFRLNEINIEILAINLPGLGSVEKDYKGFREPHPYSLQFYSSQSGANGNGTLENAQVNVVCNISLK